MNKNLLEELTEKSQMVMKQYQEEFPEIKVDRDYYPFKITEEWGECMQAYLMLTDRGRQKGKNKDEVKQLFSQEFADVFCFLLLFAKNEGIDIEKEIEAKWFSRIEK
ncbi:pyrophosphatase [Patescibacteria group bacterium]|nr:pyrophosphatase [Patescibacteria group bacterium]MCG2687376.1 pyrophosphatase [Candidatus Parcubacteria bacterium]